MKHYDFLIVGSGLFGSVFASRAVSLGKSVLVLEKREHPGGNIYTENIEGIEVHRYGAHIFHTSSERVWNYVNDFAEFNSFINSPIANYKGEIYNLPFNMNTFAQIFGVSSPEQARKRIEEERREIKRTPENLEEQAISLVGRTVYTKLIKGYTEKQWGRACTELPCSIIKRIPVRFTYNNNYFDDPLQGIPKEGYTKLINRLLQGCELRLGTDFLTEKEKYFTLADKVLYTGPIDEYFGYVLGKLEYRSLRFETSVIDCDNFQGNAVVNYTEREVPYTRIIEHRFFNPSAAEGCKKTVITREYPAKSEQGLSPCYPINDERNNRLYNEYARLAEKEKLLFGGRLAEYKYYDMDDTVEAALKLSDKVL